MRTRSPETRPGRGSALAFAASALTSLVCAASLGSLGCASLATHQGTTPAPPGKWQAAASVGAVLLADTEQKTRAPGPEVGLAVRRGLTTDVDAGLKLSPFGLDALLKWRVLSGSWPVAVAPSFGVMRVPRTGLTTDAFYTWAHLPILFGHRLSDRVQLHLGPHLIHGYFLPMTGGSAHGLSVGGFVNLEWRVAPNARIVPEVALFNVVVGEVPIRGWMGYVGPAVLIDM